jgi:chromosome segregation ATPase
VLLIALVLLSWLWNERQELLSQLAQMKAAYSVRVSTLEALNKDTEAEYERKLAEANSRVAELSTASDSLRGQLHSAQQRISTLSAEQCQRASGKLLKHLDRGAELASRCAAQLERTDAALGTCVRSYENVKNVYDPH